MRRKSTVSFGDRDFLFTQASISSSFSYYFYPVWAWSYFRYRYSALEISLMKYLIFRRVSNRDDVRCVRYVCQWPAGSKQSRKKCFQLALGLTDARQWTARPQFSLGLCTRVVYVSWKRRSLLFVKRGYKVVRFPGASATAATVKWLGQVRDNFVSESCELVL